MTSLISTETLEALISTGSVTDIIVTKIPPNLNSQKSGFAVQAKSGLLIQTLKSQRLDMRVFKSLDTVSNFLEKMGVDQFQVKTS